MRNDDALYGRTRRTTFRREDSPASRTEFTTLKPAFLKAFKDLTLLSSGSATTAQTSELVKTNWLRNSRIYHRTQPQARHIGFSDCQVDTCRGRFRAELLRVLRVVGPKIPLNPPDWPLCVFDHEYVRRVATVDARAVFRLDARRIGPIIPPCGDMGGGEPLLKQGKVGSVQRTE